MALNKVSECCVELLGDFVVLQDSDNMGSVYIGTAIMTVMYIKAHH
jgi:hypothetical protein